MANPKKTRKSVSNKKGSLTEQNNTTQGNDSDKMIAQAMPLQKSFKVKLPIKFAVITLSVIALSWFFEGCRQIQNSITLAHIAVLIGGTLFTAILLWLQAFWIYLEEKYKGTLKNKNAHFEQMEEYWNAKFKSLNK